MYTSITVDFNNLKLDDKNPRFVTKAGKTPSQNEIMHYLIEFESVIELAETIIQFGGLVPGERLLVIKADENYIVLEGNRRTAAIMLLLKPQEIINSIKLTKKQIKSINNFKKVVNEDLTNNLSQFQVDVVPSRDDAIYSLTVRHIDGIKKWSQISKMYFYQQHFDSGKDLSVLSEYTGENERSIADILRKYSFLRFVLDSYRSKYPESKHSDPSFETQIQTELIIQRIFNSLKDRFKFEFDNTYKFKVDHYSAEQLVLLKNVLADIGYLYWDLEKINTRNLNRVDQFNDVFFNENHKESTEESIAIGKLMYQLQESLNRINPNEKDSNNTGDFSKENNKEENPGDEKDKKKKKQATPNNKTSGSIKGSKKAYNLYLDVKSKQRVKIYDDFDLSNLIINATDSNGTNLKRFVRFSNNKFINGTIFSGDAPLGTYFIQAKLDYNNISVSRNLTIVVYQPKTSIKTILPKNSLFNAITAFCLDNKIKLDIDSSVNGLIEELQSLEQPEKYQLMIAASVRQLVELSVTKVLVDKNLKHHGNTKNNLKFLIEEKFQDNRLFTEICKGDIKIKYNATKNLLGSIDASQLWDYLNLITHDSNSSIYTELVEKINKQILPLLIVFHNYLKLQIT